MQRLDQDCELPVGTRDACHVPFVVARKAYGNPKDWELKPGEFVKFTNDKYTEFVTCTKEEAQGILNPFLDEISTFENVIVFMMPGITGPVQHEFEINPQVRLDEKEMLEVELEERKEQNPECADCYMIRNNRVIRM